MEVKDTDSTWTVPANSCREQPLPLRSAIPIDKGDYHSLSQTENPHPTFYAAT